MLTSGSVDGPFGRGHATWWVTVDGLPVKRCTVEVFERMFEHLGSRVPRIPVAGYPPEADLDPRSRRVSAGPRGGGPCRATGRVARSRAGGGPPRRLPRARPDPGAVPLARSAVLDPDCARPLDRFRYVVPLARRPQRPEGPAARGGAGRGGPGAGLAGCGAGARRARRAAGGLAGRGIPR